MGKKTKEQTVTTNPWAPASAAVKPALSELQSLNFDAQGNLIPMESTLQKQAMQGIYDYSQNDPMQSAAMGYYGNILGGQTNPYLDAMFGQASNAVRSKLDSQFAAAGRYGSSDHAREMQQGYSDLANQMYGGQYNADQARMMQAAQIAPSAGYAGLERQLSAAGGLENFDYNQQMQQLQNYLGQVSPLMAAGSTTTQPVTQNRWATGFGALAGVGSLLGGLGSAGLLGGAGGGQ
jgi:hypothetical protein